jgi:DNA/RNA-binding domain of Phe-tRNA-synthetase-like protein
MDTLLQGVRLQRKEAMEKCNAQSSRFEVNTSAERTVAQPDPAFRALQGDKTKSKPSLSTVTKRALKEPREALPVKDLKS